MCSIGSVERGTRAGIRGLPRILRHSIAFSDVVASGHGVDVGVVKHRETHIKTTPRDIAARMARVKGHLRRLLRTLVCLKRVRMANLGITRDEVDNRNEVVYVYP